MLKFVAPLPFAEDTLEETINEVLAGFGALAAGLPGVRGASGGANVSPAGLDSITVFDYEVDR